jgi:isopentenyl diphosphate isomerase/L-lactate dehydrogenase-like FMN-dependent dehydrogenase
MANKKNVSVQPTGDGDWGAKREGADRYSRRCDTQKEAIETGRRMAQDTKGELTIRGTNGQIREKRSYGNDPCPPKDKD